MYAQKGTVTASTSRHVSRDDSVLSLAGAKGVRIGDADDLNNTRGLPEECCRIMRRGLPGRNASGNGLGAATRIRAAKKPQ
jgi:hypothetical protein